MAQVIIVAPDAAVRDQLKQMVDESGVSSDVRADFEDGLAAIQKDPPMLVLAENPPDQKTMEKLNATLKSHAPVTPLLIYLDALNSDMALQRMNEGAYDCLCRPLSPGDFLAAGKRAVSRVGRRLLTSRAVADGPWWRQPVTYVTAGLLLFVGLLAMGLFGLWAPPFQIYKLGSEHPVALAAQADLLWVADWSQQNLTALRVQGDYVSIVDVKRLADFQPVAVANAPFYVYTASADGRLRRHRQEEGLSVAASVPAPGPSPSGLAWDGDSLWSTDSETNRIYRHDAGLAVKAQLASPAEKTVGLAWHKDSLWVADGKNNVLWRMTFKNNQWNREGPLSLEVFAHNKNLSLSGFTVWKDRAWIVSEKGGLLLQHRLPEQKR